MNEIGWKYYTATPGANYPAGDAPDVALDFKAKKLKVKTATNLTISFDGKNDHISIVAADGLVDFDDVNKGKLWLKGAGAATVMAWDGN